MILGTQEQTKEALVDPRIGDVFVSPDLSFQIMIVWSDYKSVVSENSEGIRQLWNRQQWSEFTAFEDEPYWQLLNRGVNAKCA